MGPSKWILDKISLFILKVSSHIRQEFIERRNMDALLSRLCVWGGVCVCVCAQSCPTLCDPMDYSLPGCSGHGILKAKILEWCAIPFSRDLPYPGIKPKSPTSPALANGLFTSSAEF